MSGWDYETDVVVVGSGAGGMTAALTAHREGLRTLVLEKTGFYGGSTAISGGGIWVPNNPLMAEVGIRDSVDNARTYMQKTVGDRVPWQKQEAFIRHAPEMIRSLSRLPHVEFRIMPDYADYYPERPGGLTGGRSLYAPIFSATRLGEAFDQLRPSPLETPFGMVLSIPEVRKIALLRAHPAFGLVAARVLTRSLLNKLLHRGLVAMGAALVARLRMALLEREVPLWLHAGVSDLVVEDGAVRGVAVKREGGLLRIRATKAVILAAGGFARNQAMRERYQKRPVDTRWTAAAEGNTGDLIEIGARIGAALDLMDDSWGMPTALAPDVPALPLVAERAYPGAIMVDRAGRRFTNESASYVDVVHAMYEAEGGRGVRIPAYFVMDQRFRSRFILGLSMPGVVPEHHLASGYVRKASSLGALAEQAGIDPTGLEESVERFNAHARKGKDPDFGRGESAYDRFYSHPSLAPNPCLAPIEKPPFYCIEVFPGDIGTKGGLLTNENAQVLTMEGAIIEGLYATGNTAASVMGNTYPGPGATIAPSMAFGYVAALYAAGRLP